MFGNETVLYLDDHFKLGRYLGPIDDGPTMMAKISTRSIQTIHWSTYCGAYPK